jgi:hypothetical protein
MKPRPDANKRAKVLDDVVALVRKIYRDRPRSEAQILTFDPNEVDELDPNLLYELLVARYGVPFDDSKDYFGGYGGTIGHTIDFLTARWDGKTLNDVELPPGEEYWQ